MVEDDENEGMNILRDCKELKGEQDYATFAYRLPSGRCWTS